MTEPNNHAPTDSQSEKIIQSLRDEIADLKSQLKKKDDRISSLDVMLNQIMESYTAEVRAYEDLEDKLKDAIEMIRKRTPYSEILDYLKATDSNKFQFRKLW